MNFNENKFVTLLGIIVVFIVGFDFGKGYNENKIKRNQQTYERVYAEAFEDGRKNVSDTQKALRDADKIIANLEAINKYIDGYNKGYQWGYAKGFYEGMKTIIDIQESKKKPLTNHPKK